MASKNATKKPSRNARAAAGDTGGARPVLKWAGGKAHLVERIARLMPREIDTYYEPFVGGGAMFFHLWSLGRIKRAVLADACPELIECYEVIKSDPERLSALLAFHGGLHSKSFYYKLRSSSPPNALERAARTIYLNKAGYNGLYRVNQQGEFNVPWGKRKTAGLPTPEAIKKASEALQCAELRCERFGSVRAVWGTDETPVIYLDPPYVDTFGAYTVDGFSIRSQMHVAERALALGAAGAVVIASNSNCRIVKDLYEGARFRRVTRSGTMNSKGSKRGKVPELLISMGPRVKSGRVVDC